MIQGTIFLGIGWDVGYAETPDKSQITESIQNQLKLLEQMPEESAIARYQSAEPAKRPAKQDQHQEIKKLSADIWTERKDDKASLIVHFDNGLPYPALFRRGEYLYLAFSFPTDISQKKWSDAVVPEITALEIIPAEEATVVRWKIDHVYPQMRIDDANNQFIIEFLSEKPNKEGFDLEVFQPRRQGEPFTAKLKNAQADAVFDLANGQSLFIVFADQTNKIISAYDYPDFTILESYQGVAFELKSEDLECSYVRKMIHLNKLGGLGNSIATVDVAVSEARTIFDDFAPDHPAENVRDLIAKVYSGNPTLEDAVDLVWNYVFQGLSLESQGVMHGILVKNSDLELNNLWKVMTGLAALMRGQYDLAQKKLETIHDEPDVALWLSIARCCGSRKIDPLQVAQVLSGKKYLMKLPPVVRDKLWFRILEFGMIRNQQKILEEYTLKGDSPTTRIAQPMYRLASSYLQLDPQNPSTVNALFDIWQASPTTKVGILAAFERLKFLRKAKQITPEHELKELEKLRFQWRGDHLEYMIAKYLIDRYMEEKQYMKLLPVARKTIKYFVVQSHDDGLPQLMQEALVKYFQQDDLPVLEMLSIFQEYTGIAPDNDQGDMIMIKATNILANLELYDVVVNLLRDYLSQKTKNGDNAQGRRDRILYRMAVAYHLDRKFPDALKTLDEIKKTPESLIDDVAILRSEAYLQSGHEEKALSELGDTTAQLIHKAEILLGDRKWSQAQQVYHTLLFNKHTISDTDKAHAIVNYILCLYMDKNPGKLRQATADFAEFMKGKPGEQAFELLTVPDAKVSLTHLQSIHQIASFTERLTGLFSEKS